MTEIQISVKDVDEETFQELKAAAAKRKMKVGTALTLAMHEWVSSHRKPLLPLSSWKTIKSGKGNERISEQVDEILYGE